MAQAAEVPFKAPSASPSWDITAPLQYGPPESVGMHSGPLRALRRNTSEYEIAANYSQYSNNEIRPLYPGATVLVGHRNTIVSHFSAGYSYLYADGNGTLLPEEERIKVYDGSIYDVASLSKLFTTILALDAIGRGDIVVDKPVATYIPEFATNNKSEVTVEQLLTHTSGFQPDPEPGLYPTYATYEERKRITISHPLKNPPGAEFVYSDLNMMNMAWVLEAVSGMDYNDLMRDRFLDPMGMSDSFFNKGNVPQGELAQYERIVATEYQSEVLGAENVPPRPQPVRGTVHDENAWALNGVAGHAGIFSTAYDLAKMCQMILNRGTYNGVKILEPWTVDLIFHDFNTKFPTHAHGLGFELNQAYWSGPMASLQTAGHTGFTGTTLAIDRPSATFWILLTNRVHPSRKWSSINIQRQNAGYFIAQALGLHPKDHLDRVNTAGGQ